MLQENKPDICIPVSLKSRGKVFNIG